MTLATEYEFTLPKGYVDADGTLHRTGVMRLATARDEIEPLRDPRVAQNDAYLTVVDPGPGGHRAGRAAGGDHPHHRGPLRRRHRLPPGPLRHRQLRRSRDARLLEGDGSDGDGRSRRSRSGAPTRRSDDRRRPSTGEAHGAGSGGCTPTEDLWDEIAYLAYHLHWDLDALLDLEHADRLRMVDAVADAERTGLGGGGGACLRPSDARSAGTLPVRGRRAGDRAVHRGQRPERRGPGRVAGGGGREPVRPQAAGPDELAQHHPEAGRDPGRQPLRLAEGVVRRGLREPRAKLERRSAAITLLALDGTRLRAWNLADAFAVKWTGPSFAAVGANGAATEELEIAHHGFQSANPDPRGGRWRRTAAAWATGSAARAAAMAATLPSLPSIVSGRSAYGPGQVARKAASSRRRSPSRRRRRASPGPGNLVARTTWALALRPPFHVWWDGEPPEPPPAPASPGQTVASGERRAAGNAGRGAPASGRQVSRQTTRWPKGGAGGRGRDRRSTGLVGTPDARPSPRALAVRPAGGSSSPVSRATEESAGVAAARRGAGAAVEAGPRSLHRDWRLRHGAAHRRSGRARRGPGGPVPRTGQCRRHGAGPRVGNRARRSERSLGTSRVHAVCGRPGRRVRCGRLVRSRRDRPSLTRHPARWARTEPVVRPLAVRARTPDTPSGGSAPNPPSAPSAATLRPPDTASGGSAPDPSADLVPPTSRPSATKPSGSSAVSSAFRHAPTVRRSSAASPSRDSGPSPSSGGSPDGPTPPAVRRRTHRPIPRRPFAVRSSPTRPAAPRRTRRPALRRPPAARPPPTGPTPRTPAARPRPARPTLGRPPPARRSRAVPVAPRQAPRPTPRRPSAVRPPPHRAAVLRRAFPARPPPATRPVPRRHDRPLPSSQASVRQVSATRRAPPGSDAVRREAPRRHRRPMQKPSAVHPPGASRRVGPRRLLTARLRRTRRHRPGPPRPPWETLLAGTPAPSRRPRRREAFHETRYQGAASTRRWSAG